MDSNSSLTKLQTMTTTPAPDFRELCEALDLEAMKLHDKGYSPKPNQITFNDSSTEEVIRLDKEGFHYKGQFIADAGEAHRLMLAFLKQHAKIEQEPPTDEELVAAFAAGIAAFPPQHPDAKHLSVVEYEVELEVRKARAILERWGK